MLVRRLRAMADELEATTKGNLPDYSSVVVYPKP
jgi:hypothetical protein